MSIEQSGTTADGLPQYRRRWIAQDPWCAMVLVHGINEHSGRYEHVGDILSSAGVDVLAADNRGHGLSGGRRGHIDSFDQYTADLVDPMAVQAELGVPVALLGHSLGGLISTRYLQSSHPQPTIAALSGPALGAVVPTWQRKGAPILSKIMPRLRIPGEIDDSLLSNDPAVGEAFAADPLRLKTSTTMMGNEIFVAMTAANGEIDRIDVPLRIMHGEQDRVVPPGFSEILADVPGSVRITYPGLQHEIFNEAEHPQILADLISWMREKIENL